MRRKTSIVAYVVGAGFLCAALNCARADAQSTGNELVDHINAARAMKTANPSGAEKASRDPNGDDQIESLNAAQLGAAYKGPTYYKGQAIPAARPVVIDTGKSGAPVSAGISSEKATPPPVSKSATDAYHGALYHPAGSSPLPPPQAY
ncbi:hypothetical protein [Acetobacter sp.]|uniref:hypothetical protein n=1 Tax=Acetobacter sp. TaxID=440 RepID=UPI0039EC523B